MADTNPVESAKWFAKRENSEDMKQAMMPSPLNELLIQRYTTQWKSGHIAGRFTEKMEPVMQRIRIVRNSTGNILMDTNEPLGMIKIENALRNFIELQKEVEPLLRKEQ